MARLHAATRAVLREWTERLRAEAGDAFPKVTAFRPEMAVHGRYREPCPVCGAPVQRIVYADNEANYCARCQTDGKLLADRALSRLLHEDWPRTLEELEERRPSGGAGARGEPEASEARARAPLTELGGGRRERRPDALQSAHLGRLRPQRHRPGQTQPLRRHGEGALAQPRRAALRVAHPARRRLRRLRARHQRPARLDPRRRPPLHGAPQPAAPEHDGGAGRGAARRRRRRCRRATTARCANWVACPTRCCVATATPASTASAGTRRWSSPRPRVRAAIRIASRST